MAEGAKDKSCYQPGVGYIPPTVPLSAKEVAERLAGPHDASCGIVVGRSRCSCSRPGRGHAIEAAIKEARRQGREEMREEAAKLIEEAGYKANGLPAYEHHAEKIRALPLEGPGEEGR